MLFLVFLLPSLLFLGLTAWAGLRQPRSEPLGQDPVVWPDLHVLFPLGSWQEGWEEALEDWFTTPYPGTMTLHFCPDHEQSPWTRPIKRCRERHPEIPVEIRFLIPSGRVNPKVEKLAVLESRIASGLLWICDAGIHPMHPLQVQQEVAEHLFRGRDATFFSYRVKNPNGLAARMEALYLGRHVAGSLFLSWSLFRFPLVVGKSLLLSLGTLQMRGGFSGLERYLAEDQVLGEDWQNSGARLGPSRGPMALTHPHVTLKALSARLGRWARLRSLLHPWLTVGECLVGWPTGLLALGVVSGQGSVAWGLLAWLLIEGWWGLGRGGWRTEREIAQGLLAAFLLGMLSTMVLPWGLMGHRVTWQETRVRLGRRTRIQRFGEEEHPCRVHGT